MAKKSFRKKSLRGTQENPFNIKVNRSKHSILGQKVKGTKGLPGVSHSINNAKRKEMWRKKKLQDRKANRFLDKRLMDPSIPLEERATLRQVQERKKKLKKNIFNLNEEEDLAHKGIAFQVSSNLDNKGSDSEDDDQLTANFVNEAHFGGFSSDSKSVPLKSRKEIIDEMIVESKRKKQERKVERELNTDLTEKLDEDWKNMHSIMSGIKFGKQDTLKEKNDPYDVIIHELKFELRAAPTSRLKTPEEIAHEEKEKLQKLEEGKRKRMFDVENNKAIIDSQLSADSIYDGLELEPIPVAESDHEQSENDSKSEESESDGSENSENEEEMCGVITSNNENSILQTDEINIHSRIPESKEEFRIITNDDSVEKINKKIGDIISANLPKKSPKALYKLETFFEILLEYLFESYKNLSENVEASNSLFGYLYALAEVSPLQTAKKCLNLLDAEYEIFQQTKGQSMKFKFPRPQTLLLLKLISTLYSVSDFRHPVVTPAVIFMCDILSNPYHTTVQNVMSRLFVTKILLNCVADSKRLVPESLCFLNKVLQLAVKEGDKTMTAQLKSTKFDLILNEESLKEEIAELNVLQIKKPINDDLKLSIIYELINQLQQYASLYSHICSYSEIFSPIRNICSKLPVEQYPNVVRNAVSQLTQIIANNNCSLNYLTFPNTKPKPLKLFEPSFDSKFTNKKDDIAKKRKLVKRVSQKIRKEEKGLLREIRKDSQMVAAEKLNEKLQSDAERKRKVKQLYQELAMQEGEFKKYIKKK